MIHNTFQMLGISMQSETFSALGRVDTIVKTATHIYALEFKLDKTADIALSQIFDREYLRPYQLDKRTKVAVGINFSATTKSVETYVVKETAF